MQKLGLSANSLRTVLSSLTSTLTTLRTDAGTAGLTLRHDISERSDRREFDEASNVDDLEGAWNVYCGRSLCLRKCRYDLLRTGGMVDEPYLIPGWVTSWAERSQLSHGVARAHAKFAEGAERVVFQCTEVVSADGGATVYTCGPRLVAKEARHLQHLNDHKFHRTFCRTQGAHTR